MKIFLALSLGVMFICLALAALLDSPSAEYSAGLTATLGAREWEAQQTAVFEADLISTPEAVTK